MDPMLLQVGQAAQSLVRYIEEAHGAPDLNLMDYQARLILSRLNSYKQSMTEKAVAETPSDSVVPR